MHKRWIAGFATFLFCTTAAGCEITASAYLQHEYNTDPRLHSKPDGLAKAEIKITRLIGKDAKKRARNWNRAHFAAIPTSRLTRTKTTTRVSHFNQCATTRSASSSATNTQPDR